MAKSKKNVKKEKVQEDAVDIDPKTENSTEVEDESTQGNGDIGTKKRGKAAKKEEAPPQEDAKDDVDDSETQENGEVSTEKKPADKKGKAKKKVAAKPAIEPARKSSRTPKPVPKENGENESYEVESLVEFRFLRGKPQFLVRWKGYTRGDDTWEDEKDLCCPELLQKYKASNPDYEKKAKKRSATKSPVKSPAKKAKTKKRETNYEVEQVVGMRVKNGKKEFKIRWKGYKAVDDTWEPENNLSCQDLIEAYEDEHRDEAEEEVIKTPAKRTKVGARVSKSKRSTRK